MARSGGSRATLSDRRTRRRKRKGSLGVRRAALQSRGRGRERGPRAARTNGSPPSLREASARCSIASRRGLRIPRRDVEEPALPARGFGPRFGAADGSGGRSASRIGLELRLGLAMGVGRQGWEETPGRPSARGALLGSVPSGADPREGVFPQAREAESGPGGEWQRSPSGDVSGQAALGSSVQGSAGRLGLGASSLLGASGSRSGGWRLGSGVW